MIANPDTPEFAGPWNHACQLQSFLDPKKGGLQAICIIMIITKL